MKIYGLLAVLLMVSASICASEGLVAPVYPGAHPVEPQRLQVSALEFGGAPSQRTYWLVRDDWASVAAFYEKRGNALGQEKRSLVNGVAADLYSAEVLEASETVKRLQDYTLARPAGLQVLVPRPREESVYFGALKDAVAKGHHSQQELDQVAARYGWLESCVFPPMQNDYGGWQPADEVLVERYYAAQQTGFSTAAVDMDDIARKMQELMAEGKLDEAMELSQEMASSLDNMGEVSSADSWDQGIELLQELESLAYRLVLIIDKQPEEWKTP